MLPPVVELPKMQLTPSGGLALHAQLADAICQAVRRQELRPGDRLPPVQDVANAYGLSIGTVMRAFSELGRQGVLRARRGAGTYVQESPQATTELLVPDWLSERPTITGTGFHESLLNGLRRGFNDGERRYCSTYTSGGPLSATELLAVCEARRADSVVTLGASWREADSVSFVGRHLPTVCIAPPEPVSNCDTVSTKLNGALRTFIRERWQDGQREIALVGHTFMVGKGSRPTVYDQMQREYQETMLELDGSIALHLSAGHDVGAVVNKLLPGSCVVALTPRVAEQLDPTGEKFDMVTFTENPDTVLRLRDVCTFLYSSIVDTARAAAELLRERQRDGLESPSRHRTLTPQLLTKGVVS